jgi:hypothetical protein
MPRDPENDSRLLSEDEIWAADDIHFEDVEIPEWPTRDGRPGVVRLRTLYAEQVKAFMGLTEDSAKEAFVPRLVVQAAVRADGSPLFTGDLDEAVKKLLRKSMPGVNRLQDAVLRQNGLLKTKEAVKND